jgi:signal transduction histidine kinase
MREQPARQPRSGRRILRGLRAQLLLWTILPLALVLILLSVAGVTRHRKAMTQLVEERDRGLVTAEANRLGREIAQRTADLARLAVMLPTDAEPSALEALLAAADSDQDGLALLDEQGALIAASSTAAAWSGDQLARIVAARASAVNQPQYETAQPGAEDARLLIGVPASGGRVLVGALPLAALRLTDSSMLVESEAQGTLWVLDAGGRPIHHHDATGLTPDDSAFTEMPRTGSGSRYLRDANGRDLLVSYAHVEPVGWTLLTVEDVRAITAMGVSVVEILPLLLLFIALTALLAVSLGVLNVVRPLQELDRRAARVAWGDFDAIDRPLDGIQEIEDLRATLAQMTERLRSYQSDMRDYLTAITCGQEDERSRLAHELHDVTIQGLIALKQRSQMAQKAFGRDPARAAARLAELSDLIDTEIAGLRHIIGDLRPIYLEDLGFVPALEMLARQTQEHHGLPVHLAVHGEAVRLPSDLELAAYRIVQQAVTNIAAHARARLTRGSRSSSLLKACASRSRTMASASRRPTNRQTLRARAILA